MHKKRFGGEKIVKKRDKELSAEHNLYEDSKDFSDEELRELEEEFIATYIKTNVKPLQMLIKIYFKYWKELLLALVFYLIKHSPSIILPLVTSLIINFVAYPGKYDIRFLIFAITGEVLLLILNIPMNTLYTKTFSKVMRRVEAGLRGAMVIKLQQLSITFHKEMQNGRIQSKLMRDVETVHGLAAQLFSTFPIIVFNVVAALIIVCTKSWFVFGFFLLCVPASVFTILFFRKKMIATNKEYRVKMEDASANLMDMVEMTEITRAHALEEREIRKLSLKLRHVASSGVRVDAIQGFFGATSWVIFTIFQLGCLAFSAFLAFKGRIPVGDISLYQIYFQNITNYIAGFVAMLPGITKGLDSISSIGEILASEDVEQNEGKEKLTCLSGEYEFRNIEFSYDGNTELLEDFSLRVKSGETVAFVGESGCGKTTLINLILGFNFADGGELVIDGKNIKDIDLRSYRSHIAIVPQNTVLFTGTIRENITYGIEDATDEQISAALDAACLTEFIKTLPNGIDTSLAEHGANISGGQKQRISIARAIIRNPSVILFDEATSALDNASERVIQEAIDNLTQNHTTFIVAHRLSTVKNADKIAVLQGGRCVELGTYEELMAKKGVFYEMQTR